MTLEIWPRAVAGRLCYGIITPERSGSNRSGIFDPICSASSGGDGGDLGY